MDLQTLIGQAISRKSGNDFYLDLGDISNPIVEAYQKYWQTDTQGYKIVLDESAIRHSLKNHGNPEKELARGNIAIIPNDFTQIIDCLQFPDVVSPGMREGYLECRKQINGHIIVVSTIRRGRKKLAVVTVYKKPRLQK